MCFNQCSDSCRLANRVRTNLILRERGEPYTLDFLTKDEDQQIEQAYETIKESNEWQTFNLWFLGWTCRENCSYECMQRTNTNRIETERPPLKYYGKWPFYRILGIQEFFSTLFSIFNFVPFYQYFFSFHQHFTTPYFMKELWFGYTISGMNTWIWSTAFHARDNILTERLDYFCATFSILYLLTLAIVRIFRIPKMLWIVVIGPLLAYFAWHCYNLHYIEFDYGWNMTMMVAFGVTYCLLWYIWALFNPNATHRWKIVVANTMILIFAGFEVFDFPPLWMVLDAHAIWHFATPFVTYLTFSFAIDDAEFLHKQTVKTLVK